MIKFLFLYYIRCLIRCNYPKTFEINPDIENIVYLLIPKTRQKVLHLIRTNVYSEYIDR